MNDMATNRTVSLPDDLLMEIEDLARQENKTPQDVIRAAVERFHDDANWQSLVGYGHERARTLGITESDIERLIAETRSERARR